MKLNAKSFNIGGIAGGIVGGVAAKYVETFFDADSSAYLKIGVQAVAGAAIGAFSKNSMLNGLGSGMVGVAGYNLGKELGIGEEAASNTATSGVGSYLQGQHAIGALQAKRNLSNLSGVGAANPLPVGQQNVQ